MATTSQRWHMLGVCPRQVPGHLAYLTAQTALGWISTMAAIALPLFPLWADAAAKLEVALLRAGMVAAPPPSRPTIAAWRAMTHALTSIPVAAIGTLAWVVLVACGGLVVQAPYRAVTDQPVVGGASGPTGPVAALVASALALAVLAVVAWLAAAAARVASDIATRTLWSREDLLRGHIDELAHRQALREEAAAAERVRLERTLHDGAQLHLAATAMHLGMIELAAGKVDDPAAKSQLLEHLDAAREENERALDDVRSVATGLRPEPPASLSSALTELVYGLPVSGTADIDLPTLSAEAESALLLIAKEAVTNALRHSGCSSVTIAARRSADQIALTVRDDGAGGVDPDRGTGVRGMRARARSLGGEVAIISPEGGPTTVRATIPYPTSGMERS